jgi:hypothetical protein
MSLFEENAEILARMARNGSDLGPSRTVDFAHVFPDGSQADAFAAECRRDGHNVIVEEVSRDEEPWDVVVSLELQPSAENITLWEERFDERARRHKGRADGWGFLRI